jgi:HrpA-like RNA helicase
MKIIKKNIKDILNSSGKGKNFITNEKYSPEYIELANKWSKLPLYTDTKKINDFFKLIDKNQVLLIVSGTGSGKTVLIPKFLLRYFMATADKDDTYRIGITNPKIITTVNNAEYSAKTLDVKLGEEVGYGYASAPNNSYGDKTKLLYLTDGLLSSTILSGDKYLSEYRGVIIDEAHERQINIDLLLGLLKKVLLNRPEFKLIIMSATIDTKIFKDYFIKEKLSFDEMDIAGQPNFPIANNWLDPAIHVNDRNYMDKAVDLCFSILDKTDKGDIIVFVPGVNDALKGCKLLKENCLNKLTIKRDTCSSIFCIEVFGKMDDESKKLAIDKDLYKVNNFKRKVIFATNVAESSITFDGLVYVVDTGLEFHSSYDPETNTQCIKRQHTSQAQIKQRIGRTGRTTNGIAYYLYNEKQFKNFNQYPEPGILLNDLTDNILAIINYAKTIKNVISILSNLITPPHIQQVIQGIYKLFFLDAIKMIDDKDKPYDINNITHEKIKNWKDFENMNGTITTIGIHMLKFKQTSVLSSYAILASHFMNCAPEIITIMAIIDETNGQLYSLFKYQNQDEPKVKEHFKKSLVNGSDHLSMLYIYNDFFKKNNMLYLNVDAWGKIEKRIGDLQDIYTNIDPERFAQIKEKYIKISIEPFKNQIDNIYYILGLSHFFNLLKKVGNEYESQHFLNNSTAKGEFIKLLTNSNLSEYAICHGLSDGFGRKGFKCITHLSPDIIKLITG